MDEIIVINLMEINKIYPPLHCLAVLLLLPSSTKEGRPCCYCVENSNRVIDSKIKYLRIGHLTLHRTHLHPAVVVFVSGLTRAE